MMAAETERKAIEDLWPSHLPHLPPIINKMGQPFTDADHGVVCNCGDVLGWPEDAKAAREKAMTEVPREHIYTDPSGTEWISTPENPHPDDPRYQPEVVEHHYDAAMDPSSMAGQENSAWDGSYHDAVEDAEMASEDPADEAQAARYTDVHLPPVTDEQLARAGEALAEGDREGFHQALTTGLPEHPPVSGGNLPARRSDVVTAEDPIAARITIIDPSLPYGPADVEHQLLDIAARIERGVHFQRYWEERAHNAKIDWELGNARAIIAATGGDVATRRAQALLDCEDEYRELQVCDTMVKAIRETMHNLRSLQSGYQTVARSVGASMQNFPQRGA
jgi:hypothetical protein